MKAIRVPTDFVERLSAHSCASYDAWTRARPTNDFAAMRPFLETTLDLSCEYAEFFAPYRACHRSADRRRGRGHDRASVRSLLRELRAELLPLVRAICDRPAVDDGCLHGVFAESRRSSISASGSRPPSATTSSAAGSTRPTIRSVRSSRCGDVRITTRVDRTTSTQALFSTLHEAGHAMYEQGVAPALDGTPLGSGTSAGVHESQSRLWENVVGRSRGFWRHFYPQLRAAFPDPLGKVPLETFYRAINKVERSLIRTEADEVTYNLHVMLRFDLELELLEGRLAVKDLPEAWRARYAVRSRRSAPPDDRDGCLQDVHWFSGCIGGVFQGYTIGNVLSAQFYAAALRAHPEIPGRSGPGGSARSRAGSRQIYRHGRKFKADEIVERATGEPMTIAPYLSYLRAKYGEFYRLPATTAPVPAV